LSIASAEHPQGAPVRPAVPQGERILYENGRLRVPDVPIIPFIEGDGTGPDIWRAAVRVLDAGVQAAYGSRRRIAWLEVLAGEKALRLTGTLLPEQTLETIREHRVAIKGPLTTPVGGGFRSLNVTLRQTLDLYACVRPVRHFRGVPSPVRRPEDLDVVIFRENVEDIYAGIEWPASSPEAAEVRAWLRQRFGISLRDDAGLGVKPISRTGTQRLVRMAIRYALEHGRPSVTLVHKGNIMKYTEGAFRDWGYEVATTEFRDRVVTWEEVQRDYGGQVPPGRLLIQDSIADIMFQHLLLRPRDHSVLATPNLNGDYLSDAAAAIVGGIGMAPGANIGDGYAVFEATHGTAPKYAGQDKVNPGSVILSGVMMLEYLGWKEAAAAIVQALEETIASGRVTYDLARGNPDAVEVSTSAFADGIVERLRK
jgi:isocitrate dehydrogenase